jgi:hypothetical protein
MKRIFGIYSKLALAALLLLGVTVASSFSKQQAPKNKEKKMITITGTASFIPLYKNGQKNSGKKIQM